MQLLGGRDSLDVIFLTACMCRCNTPGHLLAATLLQGNGPVCVFLPLFSTERQGCTLCSVRPASQGYTVVFSPRLKKVGCPAASLHPHATFRCLSNASGRLGDFMVRLSVFLLKKRKKKKENVAARMASSLCKR